MSLQMLYQRNGGEKLDMNSHEQMSTASPPPPIKKGGGVQIDTFESSSSLMQQMLVIIIISWKWACTIAIQFSIRRAFILMLYKVIGVNTFLHIKGFELRPLWLALTQWYLKW